MPPQRLGQLIQQPAQPPQPPSANQTPDPLWSTIGQYGVGVAALLAILKAYADYNLKSAMEDRALRSKGMEQDLGTKESIYKNFISQNEALTANQGQLLNTFIARSLNQAESANEQTTELLHTIASLTEAIKFLTDSQNQQLDILYEIKALIVEVENYSAGNSGTVLATLESQTITLNQLLNGLRTVASALAHTKIIRKNDGEV